MRFFSYNAWDQGRNIVKSAWGGVPGVGRVKEEQFYINHINCLTGKCFFFQTVLPLRSKGTFGTNVVIFTVIKTNKQAF